MTVFEIIYYWHKGDKVERISGHHSHFSDFEVIPFNKRGEDSSSFGKVNSGLFGSPNVPWAEIKLSIWKPQDHTSYLSR